MGLQFRRNSSLQVSPIDNDSVISALNSEAMEMFAGCYEFASHGMPCWFGRVKEKQEAPKCSASYRKSLPA